MNTYDFTTDKHIQSRECSAFPLNSHFFLSKFMVNEINADPLRSHNAWGGGGVKLG